MKTFSRIFYPVSIAWFLTSYSRIFAPISAFTYTLSIFHICFHTLKLRLLTRNSAQLSFNILRIWACNVPSSSFSLKRNVAAISCYICLRSWAVSKDLILSRNSRTPTDTLKKLQKFPCVKKNDLAKTANDLPSTPYLHINTQFWIYCGARPCPLRLPDHKSCRKYTHRGYRYSKMQQCSPKGRISLNNKPIKEHAKRTYFKVPKHRSQFTVGDSATRFSTSRFFFLNQFPPRPWVSHLGRFFKFCRKFSEIFAAQGVPQVSLTPIANGM